VVAEGVRVTLGVLAGDEVIVACEDAQPLDELLSVSELNAVLVHPVDELSLVAESTGKPQRRKRRKRECIATKERGKRCTYWDRSWRRAEAPPRARVARATLRIMVILLAVEVNGRPRVQALTPS